MKGYLLILLLSTSDSKQGLSGRQSVQPQRAMAKTYRLNSALSRIALMPVSIVAQDHSIVILHCKRTHGYLEAATCKREVRAVDTVGTCMCSSADIVLCTRFLPLHSEAPVSSSVRYTQISLDRRNEGRPCNCCFRMPGQLGQTVLTVVLFTPRSVKASRGGRRERLTSNRANIESA